MIDISERIVLECYYFASLLGLDKIPKLLQSISLIGIAMLNQYFTFHVCKFKTQKNVCVLIHCGQ